ncbi:hypothetical protein OUZ56_000153 [Daphnia magna]|uniref:Uncharacterized protein n=1 Tax=Daphnia magna TaxID=35525 RepID=A0ABQ9ZZP2_9CRUS|nr:hypothetical protein OUZ56_000153 [Daphnia magna]
MYFPSTASARAQDAGEKNCCALCNSCLCLRLLNNDEVNLSGKKGAEPQVVPAVNRVDLSSQLSATPAGTLGLSRY